MNDVKHLRPNETWVVERRTNRQPPQIGLVVHVDVMHNCFSIRCFPDGKVKAQCKPEDFNETERPWTKTEAFWDEIKMLPLFSAKIKLKQFLQKAMKKPAIRTASHKIKSRVQARSVTTPFSMSKATPWPCCSDTRSLMHSPIAPLPKEGNFSL